jgi:hypothetical protein
MRHLAEITVSEFGEAGAAVYRTIGFRPFGMVREYQPLGT